jgi:hypothetical protein
MSAIFGGSSPQRHRRMFDLLTLFPILAPNVQKAFSPVSRRTLWSFVFLEPNSFCARASQKQGYCYLPLTASLSHPPPPARHASSTASGLAVGASAAAAEAQADSDALQHLML